MKTCTKCKVSKPKAEFYKRLRTLDGLNSHCKECEHSEIYEWRINNPQKQSEIMRRCRLKRVYGITPEQYDELLAKQNGCCALCERHESTFKTRLAVDHNHITNAIRGLLCTYCNHRVIGRHRDGTLLRKMADYVDGETGLFVPKKKKKVRRPRKERTPRGSNTRSKNITA